MDMCFNHLSFRMPESSLLMAGVRAMGLKLLGECGHFELSSLQPA